MVEIEKNYLKFKSIIAIYKSNEGSSKLRFDSGIYIFFFLKTWEYNTSELTEISSIFK
jgi:hypothetical protein